MHFWVFLDVILERLGHGRGVGGKQSSQPRSRWTLPYWLVYGLAVVVHVCSVALRPIFPRWQPFLSPFKVALAGTHHYYSCAKAKRDLGYVPPVPLALAVDQTVDYFQHQQRNQVVDKKQQ